METQANLVNGRSSASLSLNSQVLPASSDAAAPETNAPGQADGAVLAPADNNTRTPRDDGEPRSSGEGASLLASAESKQDSGSVVHQRECDNKAMGGGLSDARPAPIVTPPGGGVVFHSHFFGTPTPTSASASAASPSAAGGRRRHSHSASGANSGSRSSTGSVPRRRVSLNSGTTTPAARRRRSSAGIAPRRRRRSSAFQHDKHSLLGPIIHQKKDTWKETVWSLVDEPGSSHAVRRALQEQCVGASVEVVVLMSRPWDVLCCRLTGSVHCSLHHVLDCSVMRDLLYGDTSSIPSQGCSHMASDRSCVYRVLHVGVRPVKFLGSLVCRSHAQNADQFPSLFAAVQIRCAFFILPQQVCLLERYVLAIHAWGAVTA
mgnify:CR=1 FL=1